MTNEKTYFPEATLKGNTFNGANQLVELDGSGKFTTLDGSALTNLAAANLTGTINDARLSSNVTVQGNTFNGASQLVKLDGTSKLPAVDGSALTNLTVAASNITGTLAAGNLPGVNTIVTAVTYTITSTAKETCIIATNALLVPITITLPAVSATVGNKITIKGRGTAGAVGIVTVVAAGSDTLETFSVLSLNAAIKLLAVNTGGITGWIVI